MQLGQTPSSIKWGELLVAAAGDQVGDAHAGSNGPPMKDKSFRGLGRPRARPAAGSRFRLATALSVPPGKDSRGRATPPPSKLFQSFIEPLHRNGSRGSIRRE